MSFTIPSQKRRNRPAGQALVEFALIIPVLLFIIIGIIDLGRAFHAYIAITNASREGARYATRPGVKTDDLYTYEGKCDCAGATCFDPSINLTLKDIVIVEAAGAGIDLIRSNICFYVKEGNPPNGIHGDPMRVTVRYELDLIMGWFFSQPLQLGHYTEMLLP